MYNFALWNEKQIKLVTKRITNVFFSKNARLQCDSLNNQENLTNIQGKLA